MSLIGLFFRLLGSLIGLFFSLIGLIFGLVGGLLGWLGVPILIAILAIGLLLWQPLLWLGLGLGGYLLYRLARRRGYIEIRRIEPRDR
ncbi:TPA: hypothetical protein EYP12_06640 [Candidatus Bipolaricaulota bacterium]|nr:hypothetical protein [Candidatus Bipolaricaulota bacterium]